MDKVNERKSMATERILYILEDLNSLQDGITRDLSKHMVTRLSDQTQLPRDQVYETYVKPLLKELLLRFEVLTEPCLKGISSKLAQRVNDNFQAFK